MNVKLIRYFALEYLAYWEGRLTAPRLAHILDKRREHVQREVIAAYKNKYPGVLSGQRGRNANYELTELPRYAPKNVSAMIDYVRGESCLAHSLETVPRFGIPIEDVGAIAFREPESATFRALYRGCVQRRSVWLEYVSKQQTALILFSPHALVRDLNRLHFRGYAVWDQKQPGRYIDLVPSRILKVFEAQEDQDRYVGGDADTQWHERVTLRFTLNPALPENIRHIVRIEHEGEKHAGPFGVDTLVIPNVRRAMQSYVARSLRYRLFHEDLYEVWILREVIDSP